MGVIKRLNPLASWHIARRNLSLSKQVLRIIFSKICRKLISREIKSEEYLVKGAEEDR